MFEASPRWGGTDEKDMLENLMPFWTENYFKRENYLKIDNKPVLFVFKQDRLAEECFRSAESQRETFDACREYAVKAGFDGMIFAVCDTKADKAKHDDLMRRGYDFRFGYTANYRAPYDFYEDEDAIVKGQCDAFEKDLSYGETQFIPTASCFWDPTPRFSERWNSLGYNFRHSTIWYLSPEKFREVLRKMKAVCDALPENAWGRLIMMIDNWNEWDEGHFVAPSHKFGFRFLEAIREELTERNNLPDYIAPRDQGFGDYNTSWITPDFSNLRK